MSVTYRFLGNSASRGFTDVQLATVTLHHELTHASGGQLHPYSRKLLRTIADALRDGTTMGVSVVRVSPKRNPTLVHHGIAQGASFHLLSKHGAPFADLYFGNPGLAERVAQLIADHYGTPLVLAPNDEGGRTGMLYAGESARRSPFGGPNAPALAGPLEAIAPGERSNPAPAVGQVWKKRGGGSTRVLALAGSRVHVVDLTTGNRAWVPLSEFYAMHREPARSNPTTLRWGKSPTGPEVWKAEGPAAVYYVAKVRNEARHVVGFAVTANTYAPDARGSYWVLLQNAMTMAKAKAIAKADADTRQRGHGDVRGNPSRSPAARARRKALRGGFNRKTFRASTKALRAKPVPGNAARSIYYMERARARRNPILRTGTQHVQVTVTKREVAAFKARWPVSGLPDKAIRFVFAAGSGDLVGTNLTHADTERAYGSGALPELSRQAWRSGFLKAGIIGGHDTTPNPRARRIYFVDSRGGAHVVVSATESGRGAQRIVGSHGTRGEAEIHRAALMLGKAKKNPAGFWSEVDAELAARGMDAVTGDEAERLEGEGWGRGRKNVPGNAAWALMMQRGQGFAGGAPSPRANPPRRNARAKGTDWCAVDARDSYCWEGRGSLTREQAESEANEAVRTFTGRQIHQPIRVMRVSERQAEMAARPIPKRRSNPRPFPGEMKRARDTFRMWHEFDTDRLERVQVPSRTIPRHLVNLGEVVRIDYKSNKWEGRPVTYTHSTKRPRPRLVTDPDARQLFLVGGKMRPTADGLIN